MKYKAETPYIFAKTGTMSNNHSLVGLIRGKVEDILLLLL